MSSILQSDRASFEVLRLHAGVLLFLMVVGDRRTGYDWLALDLAARKCV